MTEPVTDTTTTDAPPEGEKETPKTFDAEYVKKLRDEAAKYRTEAKTNADAARKLAAIEDEKKSAEERAAEAQQQATTRADAADARAMRLEVAFEKGLTPQQAKRLVGASRDELEADADEIIRDFPIKSDGRPKGDADLGGRETPKPVNARQADLMQIEADLNAGKRR